MRRATKIGLGGSGLAAALLVGLLVAPLALDVHGNEWAAEVTQLRDGGRPDVAGLRIAILDTGIDPRHPALRHLEDGRLDNSELVASRDFTLHDEADDSAGHGTFLAGVLAARPIEGLASVGTPEGRLAGLLEDVGLMSGRVCRGNDCDLNVLDDAILWATASGARIIVIALGVSQEEADDDWQASMAVARAVATADAKGVLVIAAAGNTGRDGGEVLFPASLPTVLAVGAVDRDLRVSPTSARGAAGKPDVVAPGDGIVGPWRGGEQVRLHGTSAAVPFVAAAVAVVLSEGGVARSAAGAEAVRVALREAALPLSVIDGWAVGSGHGLVQARDASELFRRTNFRSTA